MGIARGSKGVFSVTDTQHAEAMALLAELVKQGNALLWAVLLVPCAR